jgi:hypothetical protein
MAVAIGGREMVIDKVDLFVWLQIPREFRLAG